MKTRPPSSWIEGNYRKRNIDANSSLIILDVSSRDFIKNSITCIFLELITHRCHPETIVNDGQSEEGNGILRIYKILVDPPGIIAEGKTTSVQKRGIVFR